MQRFRVEQPLRSRKKATVAEPGGGGAGEGEGVLEAEKAGGKGLRFYTIENSILCLQVEGLFYLTDK